MLPIFAKNQNLEKSIKLVSTSDHLCKNAIEGLLSEFPDLIFSNFGRKLTFEAVKTLLISKEFDIIVSTFEKLPKKLPDGAVMAGVSKRAETELTFIGNPKSLNGSTLRDLKENATVYTRNKLISAQFTSFLPAAECLEVKSSVSEMIKEVNQGQKDGFIVAAHELNGFEDKIEALYKWKFSPYEMVGVPADGAVIFICRMDDIIVRQFIKDIHQNATSVCTNVERKISKAFEPGTLGAYCALDERGNYITHAVQLEPELNRCSFAQTTTSGLSDKIIELLKEKQNVPNL